MSNVYVCCVCAGMLFHVCIWRPKFNSRCLFLLLSTLSLETGSLLNCNSPFCLESDKASGILLSLLLQHWGYTPMLPCPSFSWVLGIRTQVLMFIWQVFNILNHHRNQDKLSFYEITYEWIDVGWQDQPRDSYSLKSKWSDGQGKWVKWTMASLNCFG